MQDIIAKNLKASQSDKLKCFGLKINKFQANFAVFDTSGELVLLSGGGRFESDVKQLSGLSLRILACDAPKNALGGDYDICRFYEQNAVLAVILYRAHHLPEYVAMIDMGVNSAAEDKFESTQRHLLPDALSEILASFADKFQSDSMNEEQIETVSTELAQVYEELVLLHKLSSNMKVNESDAGYLQMACDSLTDIVLVEGIAILLEKTIEEEKKFVLVAGSGMVDIDSHMACTLYSRLVNEINQGKDALLDSEVDAPFKYKWPDSIKNIIAVPLFGKGKGSLRLSEKGLKSGRITGFMIAVNRIGKLDFDTQDAKLFNSVANGCAVFIENGRLFDDLKELFIGSLKALTNSIDAKDQYTRGHSERVAFIAKWIAERYVYDGPLSEEDIQKVYLAGLLHDIGKVGVNELILRKKGELTEEEYKQLKNHPSIGAGILSGIKQMQDIVPGVLCHHERMDGKGYPNSLIAAEIPLLGKIVGMADSFDAMTSERIYRKAMSVEHAIQQIKDGLGTQFDEKVGLVFINSDVHYLWNILQGGFINGYSDTDFTKYGAIAVGALVR